MRNSAFSGWNLWCYQFGGKPFNHLQGHGLLKKFVSKSYCKPCQLLLYSFNKSLNGDLIFLLLHVVFSYFYLFQKPISLHAMTQEQLKDMRDRVVVLRRFL
jgi:hypothetical protein